MDQGKKECIEKKLMEYGVLTRRMKEKLIPELTEKCNQTVTEEEVDNLAEDLFKMTCTPEDFETGKSMLELPEGETAEDIDSLLTVFAEKLNLNEDAGLTVVEPMDDVAEESVNEDEAVDRKRRSDELDGDEPEPKKVKENEGLFGGSPEEYIHSYSEKYNPMHGNENIKTEEIKLEEKDVGESIKPEEKDVKNAKKKGRPDGPRPTYLGGSPEEGREATPYLYIILGLAIKDLPKLAYEQILTILQGAMKLSEMLSNKDNCIDDFLKSMIDKRILSFFKYYVIGEIALSSNPLTLMTSLMDITLNLLPYAKTALGMTIVSSLGYYIHHYINHIGGQVKDSVIDKLKDLKTGLDELDSKTSGEVVEETNEKIKNSIKSIKKGIEEVLKEKEEVKEGELQQVIGENMTNEKEELQKHIGEFDDTMDMEQLKDKLKKKAEEEVPMEQAVAESEAEEAEDEELEGGKKKKKKGGATKKKKTNTKGKKKTSKSKKSKTKKARKTRKTRKNKK